MRVSRHVRALSLRCRILQRGRRLGKGIVERTCRTGAGRIWREAGEQRWPDLDTLNAWLAEQCRAAWEAMAHPEWPALTVAELLQDEQMRLMPNPDPSTATSSSRCRVSATALIHFQRNRYSVPTRHAHRVVSLRIYPAELVVVAEGKVVARHARSFERHQTHYDFTHYIDLIERNPAR